MTRDSRINAILRAHVRRHFPAPLAAESEARFDALRQDSPSAHRYLPDDTTFLHAMARVWTLSPFVAQTCLRHPRLFRDLVTSGELQRSRSPEDYHRAINTLRKRNGLLRTEAPADLQSRVAAWQSPLRRLRLREAVRIAWRDLAAWADLAETTRDLSTFADAVIAAVLNDLHAVHCLHVGPPVDAQGRAQSMIVIGLGKLGGEELNFSSDVDLILTFPNNGSTESATHPISNLEFFTRLGRQLIKALSETTADGLVFRVDLRLRPDGENGPLLMSFDNMEAYYQRHGREWERYALIKSRVIAGDKAAGRRLLKRLKPFVYRRYLDFGVFDALREMKRQISVDIQKKGMRDNIKLGPGGIREIEFFGQVFQLIRGGVTPDLQQRRIRSVLQTLARLDLIDTDAFANLDAAYVFLRNCEHRLQYFHDQQTHQLPQTAIDRNRLALAMGFEDWTAFKPQLDDRMSRVHRHFSSLLAANDPAPVDCDTIDTRGELACIWQDLDHDRPAVESLADLGYEDAQSVLQLLSAFKNNPKTRALSRQGRHRIDRLIPLVVKKAAAAEQPMVALKRIVQLLETIERRTCYLALLLENPNALDHLIRLASASPWIVTLLSRHPVLLDELLDPRTLYRPPTRAELLEEIRQHLSRVPAQDLEYQMEQLCIFKQVNSLRVAAADITGALPLMKVSDHLTALAEIILAEVVNLAWQHLTRRHGRPAASFYGLACDKGFAVIGYGKLGGIELGYGSDLDLVFLHAGTERAAPTTDEPISASQFFARLGQRVVHTLNAHTAAGRIYDVDMRLRPSGSSGLLVSHINAFEEYQLKAAWNWEHQALLRARPIAGDEKLMKWFQKTRLRILAQPRNLGRLRREVLEMRRRLRRELLIPDPDRFDIKQGFGGLMDIEFMVQFHLLANAAQHPDLIAYSDNVRQIQALAAHGVIDGHTAYLLRRAYLIYRAMIHRLSLRQTPAVVSARRFTDIRAKITALWQTTMTG